MAVRGGQKPGPSDPQMGASNLQPGVLITFAPDAMSEAIAAIQDNAGVKSVAYAADFAGGLDFEQTRDAGLTVFNDLGVAVADVDPDQEMQLAAVPGATGTVLSIEPEPIFFAFAEGLSPDLASYLRGCRDMIDLLYDRVNGQATATQFSDTSLSATFTDTAQTTWGLAATKVEHSKLTGRGVRVAVLDTGMDLNHPDFRGRSITAASFIQGQLAQDENGHGTHCIGTACGPRTPVRGPRYGIASEADIFIGKVLTNQGSALGRSTLAGIEWAVRNQCQIISMSLGGRVLPGQSYLQAFESTAREAMRRGSLIIAAAGNDSRRSQRLIAPVSSPANCPSILAVAALDRALRVADFSNGAINPDANIDLAAPGVDIYSSAPDPAPPPQPPFYRNWKAQYDAISGTSMATPHVAGVAALILQENPGLTASELWRSLVSRTLGLGASATDVGSGMLQL